MPEPSTTDIDTFIAKWSASGGHERGAGQYFLLDFCDLLSLEKPDAPVPENELNSYTFERRVDRKKPDGTTAPNWIDLYKSGHFVLETKQGVNKLRDKSDPAQPLLPALGSAPPVSAGHGQRGTTAFDKAMLRAHSQAERYIHALPAADGRPPFLIVCDVGHSFELYAEFSATGGQYERFPDPLSHRILLADLHDPKVRDRFRKIWSDPHALDPSLHAAAVTREVAKALADLAKSLEKDGHDAQLTAGFLQRCLFTMFAEDVGLLPADSFLELLTVAEKSPAGFPVLLQGLWADMASGAAFSATIRAAVPYFNGGLFTDTTAFPLRSDQIAYLIHASRQDWSAVEPAIFGTLLERALDPRERHKLGAHYTPRSYVERLVRPTIIEPLREKWEAVKTAAAQFDDKGKAKDALAAVEQFHRELAAIRVLDPACGSGNFLYVALELLKRLEAEVLDLFEQLGGNRQFEMDSVLLRPSNFLGIELNPRAAAIAQLCLWIGYFQWQKKTTGRADTNERPLLPKKNSIECRDAVLDYEQKTPRLDEHGQPVTIWDGRTTKPHPVTGKEVPDDTARVIVYDYTNPKKAEWAEAEFIVGNPPFIGGWKMREALGSGYVEALWSIYDLPEKTDFVMYWWAKAAELLSSSTLQRFGFITTNSITQVFQRRVIDKSAGKVSLVFAIADHAWIDSVDGAAVRIAMTVGAATQSAGDLGIVTAESNQRRDEEIDVSLDFRKGVITSDLKLGVDLSAIQSLESNDGIVSPGVQLYGAGFVVTEEERTQLAASTDEVTASRFLKPYLNAKDLVQTSRGVFLIDFFDHSEEQAQKAFPAAYQHLAVHVKPERQQNRRASIRDTWWRFGWERPKLRKAIEGLERLIVTPEVSKFRLFAFLPVDTLPDNMLTSIASDDGVTLAVLSSAFHQVWASRAGGRMGVGNDLRYTKSRCFDPFPFPALDEGPLKQEIRDLGEKLDAHRKARQAAHPDLTLTGMYNVLEKLRTGEALTTKEKTIHDQGLITILRQIHDDLDAAVLQAYGWTMESLLPAGRHSDAPSESASPSHDRDGRATAKPIADILARKDETAEELEQAILGRLVALNHERAEEEKRGLIRWLRPEYQAPDASTVPQAEQKEIELAAEKAGASTSVIIEKQKWPTGLAAQVEAIRKVLPATGSDADAIATLFGKRTKARLATITEILETLLSLGKL